MLLERWKGATATGPNLVGLAPVIIIMGGLDHHGRLTGTCFSIFEISQSLPHSQLQFFSPTHRYQDTLSQHNSATGARALPPLTEVYKDSIPGNLFEITLSRYLDLPPQAMKRKMKQAKTRRTCIRSEDSTPVSPQVLQGLAEHKEQSYKNWLKVQASNLRRRELTLLLNF